MIIAELALVATVLGDSAAALVGKGLGKNRLPLTISKTIEGYIGGLLSTYVIGFVFLFIIGVQGPDLFIVPLLPTAAIAIFDFFEDLPFWAADNLFHPLITLIFGYIFTLLHLISI
jgi:dolichol kinase